MTPPGPDSGIEPDVSTDRIVAMLDEALIKLEAVQRAKSEPIAIVGLSCRFPGADDAEAFWRLLRDGIDATTDVPTDRWDITAWFDADPDIAGKMYVRRGGFLPSVDGFDARFFDISPREAASMDPQQRLLLEVAWEALENAGIAPAGIARSSGGVFVGVTTSDYGGLLVRDGAAALDAYFSTGNALNATAGRLAHILDLHGPCLAVDTACSSSLVAVHMACQSLRAGECDMALAGGVNLILSPEITVAICRAKMLAPDGRCKTFDAGADGYVRAEGCGVVVLKRLSDALSAGDRVLALIRGSATNQDGATAGFTVPSGRAQESLIRRALANAGVAPAEIDYLEAHGTGTPLGDPIEIRAAAAVLGRDRLADRPLLIGSVKTNIGHAEAAAGIAGLIKVVLALQHSTIPRHLHFHQPNPHIAWSELPVAVAVRRQCWPPQDRRRLAGVSAFGASGTNAHIIVQEAPVPVPPAAAGVERPLHILALSAKTPMALRQTAGRYADHLETHPEQDLADICCSANTGRAALPSRLAIVASTPDEVVKRLRSAVPGAPAADPATLAFLFTGQGSHYVGMGERLYETQPSFRSTLDRCADILHDRLKRPLLEILFTQGGGWLDDTTYAQPALFALEIALAELWRAWGIRPAAVIGHSIGEYAAACFAGVFNLEDGLHLVSRRAELMGRLPAGGAMLAVSASLDNTLATLSSHAGTFAVAGANAPRQTVVSGTAGALEALLVTLGAARIPATRLRVSHAFHSPLMEPILDEFEKAACQVRYRTPVLPIISNLTGDPAGGEIATPEYWVHQLREPVRFAAGIAALRQRGCDAFLEIGPARTLLSLARQCLPDDDQLLLVSSLQASGNDWETMLDSLRKLYERGTAVDWQGFDRDYQRTRLALPTYPWQREPHWRPSRMRPEPAPQMLQGGDDVLYEVRWQPQDMPAHPSSDFWPAPDEIVSRLQPSLDDLASDIVDESYCQALAQLEDISADYVAEAWLRLGWRFEPGMQCSDAGLAGRLKVVDRHRQLLKRTAEILAEAGRLQRNGDTWVVPVQSTPRRPGDRLAHLRAAVPGIATECTLLERCGSRLVDVLCGDQDPLDLLFPDGETITATSLYRDAPGARLMNKLLQQAVALALRQLPPGRKLRVLEIGAGTGGSTAALLQVLPPERTDYLFTDISPRFTTTAREQFGSYHFLRYQVLDIERDPATQGFDREPPFDLIVAANVLHATRDLRQSLRHVRQVAAQGALLLLLEGTAPIRSVDLVFGLTDGWWRFVGDGVRSVYPLIGSADWSDVLSTSGFERPSAMALDGHRWGVLSRQAVIVARAAETIPPHWIVFADCGDVGRRLAARHRARGGTTTLVQSDEVGCSVQVDPDLPCEVIYLRSLDEPALDRATPDASADVGRLSCGGVADLIRSLTDVATVSRIWLVTCGAVGVEPAIALPGLAQSGLWGLGRVIAHEHPELRPVRIDLDPDADSDMRTSMLWDELCGHSNEDEVRRRGAVRAVSRLVRTAATSAAAPVAFREDASYLITGGLGGLGLQTARWMVEHGARTIVLAGRRSAGNAAEVFCDRLRAAGAQIIVRRTDIASAIDAEGLLDEMAHTMPPLRGIVHAAGVLDDGAVRHLSWDRFAAVLRPKVAGAWHLHRLTAARELDFFVLYSSFTGIFGTPGQGNHAAGSTFLDALAWHRRALGLPALSLDWGAWSTIGAAAERDIDARLCTRGAGMLDPAQALRLLELVWNSTSPQVAIVPIQWQRIEAQQLRRPLLAEFMSPASVRAATTSTASFLEGWHGASPDRRKILLVEHILTETGKVLGHRNAEEMDPRQGFFELGMDSLTSVELRNRLRVTLGCDLQTTIAFDHPNPIALAEFLLGSIEPRPQAGPEIAARRNDVDGLADLSIGELETLIDSFVESA